MRITHARVDEREAAAGDYSAAFGDGPLDGHGVAKAHPPRQDMHADARLARLAHKRTVIEEQHRRARTAGGRAMQASAASPPARRLLGSALAIM